jgi:hypothetical protein
MYFLFLASNWAEGMIEDKKLCEKTGNQACSRPVQSSGSSHCWMLRVILWCRVFFSDFVKAKHQFHLQWSITLSTMVVPA